MAAVPTAPVAPAREVVLGGEHRRNKDDRNQDAIHLKTKIVMQMRSVVFLNNESQFVFQGYASPGFRAYRKVSFAGIFCQTHLAGFSITEKWQ